MLTVFTVPVNTFNVKCANKTYAVIARRERELRTRIQRGVPGRKWFVMCIKWRLDSNFFKHKSYSLTCYSLVPRPHPSAREKGLVKNDTILGPLRHSGYVTTMLIAIQLAGLWFTYDHMLDMADQVFVSLQKKYRTEGSSFIWPITGKNTRTHAFFCKFINSSFPFQPGRNEYVHKKPCFARLRQGSDKLDVTSIVYDWPL